MQKGVRVFQHTSGVNCLSCIGWKDEWPMTIVNKISIDLRSTPNNLQKEVNVFQHTSGVNCLLYIGWKDEWLMAIVNRISKYLSSTPSNLQKKVNEPVHEISNNVVCATTKASDQPAYTRSLIRTFVSRLDILWLLSYWQNRFWSF